MELRSEDCCPEQKNEAEVVEHCSNERSRPTSDHRDMFVRYFSGITRDLSGPQPLCYTAVSVTRLIKDPRASFFAL